jgi:hypothetical protein
MIFINISLYLFSLDYHPMLEKLTINEFYYKYVESYIYALEYSHKQLHMDGNPYEFALALNLLEQEELSGTSGMTY